LLQIGDKVVYPMHGAGVITGEQKCTVHGQEHDFFELQMLLGNMQVMVPVDNVEKVGLRPIIKEKDIDSLKVVLMGKPETTVGTWNKRFHAIQDRMRSGDIADVAAVVRNLVLQERVRKISGGERRLLELARQIVVSELVYVCGRTQDELEQWLDDVLAANKG